MEKFNPQSASPESEDHKRKSLGDTLKNAVGMSVIAGGIALSGSPDVEAQTRTQPQREVVKVGKTAKTEWAQDMVALAKSEIGQLKNAEDVNAWVLNHVGPFVSEYYSPTKGPLVDGTYQKSRRLSPDEARFILSQTQDLETQYLNVHRKFNLQTIPNITDQFKAMKAGLIEDTSYANQKQREILENYEKGLKN